MKKVLIIAILISFLVVTGCSTISSSSPVKTNVGISINEQKTMEDNGISCAISIDKMEFDPNIQSNPNVPHTLNIYMSLKNSGQQAIGLDCFTTITDYAGVSATSLGVGNSNLLYPQSTQVLHDKILIYDQQYSAILSKNSNLGVKCMSSSPFAKPYSNNLKASWDVTPSNIQ
jgi:hypothetical protein